MRPASVFSRKKSLSNHLRIHPPHFSTSSSTLHLPHRSPTSSCSSPLQSLPHLHFPSACTVPSMPLDDVNRSRGHDSNRHSRLQNHDHSIPNADDEYTLANMAESGRAANLGVPAPAKDSIIEITASQKMVSAMSGSLLTSILGAFGQNSFKEIRLTLIRSYSPRCRPRPAPIANDSPTKRRLHQARLDHHLAHPRPDGRARHHFLLSRGFLRRWERRLLPRRAPDRRHHRDAASSRVPCGRGAAPHH